MATTNYEWYIGNNFDMYINKWIAIDCNQVLESDLKLDALLKIIKEKYSKSKPFITKIRGKLLRLHS